jgi:ribosomal protein S12 methylthiotransferase
MKRRPKTIHFVSLGCAKNRVDTEVMAGIAVKTGLKIVASPTDADVLVVNTCAFIEKAREESIEVLLEMAETVKAREGVFVAAGCMAQRYAEALAEEMPELDHIIGAGNIEALRDIIAGTADRITVNDGAAHFLQGRDTPRFIEPTTAAAYVKIADGCARKCAFCAIPAIRGKAKSRPIPLIVEEVQALAARGIREVNLVAQDTSAYGRDRGDGSDLTGLLQAISTDTNIDWIRLLYLYPDAVSPGLIDAVATLDKVVPYFDIPIQHASDHMLKHMRRGHGQTHLARLVTRIRKTIPEAFLRTAVLVGHPGETEGDFEALLSFMTWARFDHMGAFRYSPEEGTAAFALGETVSKKTSYNRFRKLMALQRRIGRTEKKRLIGKQLPILIEDFADDTGYVRVGRHLGQAPEVDGVTYVVSSDAPLKSIQACRITEVGDFDLVATPIK